MLTFPWPTDDIINQFAHSKVKVNAFWDMFFRNSGCQVSFNNLFREFHQSCALNDRHGIDKICEGRLALAVNDALKRIHFHGCDVEMANLTIE